MNTDNDKHYSIPVHPEIFDRRVSSEQAGFRRSLSYGLWIRLTDPLLRRRKYRDGLKSKR